jgi:hypothetical protein
MAYDCRVYRILIASPSDVDDEREIAVRVIHAWNDLHSYGRKLALFPLRWETHTAPDYGSRPQEVVNRLCRLYPLQNASRPHLQNLRKGPFNMQMEAGGYRSNGTPFSPSACVWSNQYCTYTARSPRACLSKLKYSQSRFRSPFRLRRM